MARRAAQVLDKVFVRFEDNDEGARWDIVHPECTGAVENSLEAVGELDPSLDRRELKSRFVDAMIQGDLTEWNGQLPRTPTWFRGIFPTSIEQPLSFDDALVPEDGTYVVYLVSDQTAFPAPELNRVIITDETKTLQSARRIQTFLTRVFAQDNVDRSLSSDSPAVEGPGFQNTFQYSPEGMYFDSDSYIKVVGWVRVNVFLSDPGQFIPEIEITELVRCLE